MSWSDADSGGSAQRSSDIDERDERGSRELFSGTKLKCLIRVSKDGIRDKAHFDRRETPGRIRFRCLREGCQFSCICKHAPSDPAMDDRWTITTIGVHEHPANDSFMPKPLREHLHVATAKEAALGSHGADLALRVTRRIGVTISAHITSRLQRKLLCSEQAECWYKMLPLLERLEESGFHTRYITENGDEESLLYCYVETCYAEHFLQSAAFTGVIFIDGAFMTDAAKHMMLAVCTTTADRIILPLALAIVDSENNESYRFLFESMQEGAFEFCRRVTVFADQHPAIESALRRVFIDRTESAQSNESEESAESEDSEESAESEESGEPAGSEESGESEESEQGYDYILMPCLWHLSKHMKGSKDFKAVIRADNKEVYKALLARYRKQHPSESPRFMPHIQRMAIHGNDSQADRCFGYFADSPVECLNSLLKKERAKEPFLLVEAFLELSLHQRARQLENSKEGLRCPQAMAMEAYRDKQSGQLVVEKKSATRFQVTEILSSQLRSRYTVHVLGGTLKCDCKGYERDGIPCRHVYAVRRNFPDLKVPDFWPCYQNAVIREALGINKQGQPLEFLVPSLTDLEERRIPLHTPKRKPGRPRTRRFRSTREQLSGLKQARYCGYCGELCHHTKRKCPERPAVKEQTDHISDLVRSRIAIARKNSRRRSIVAKPRRRDTTMQTRSKSRPSTPMETRNRAATPPKRGPGRPRRRT